MSDFEIRLYDSMTRKKQVLKPIRENHPHLYVCGPTVYDRIHIGNVRPLVVFDVLYRLLRHRYGDVTYARNITDIDDKIIARAAENKEDWRTLTGRQIKQFRRECQELGIIQPEEEPQATDYIKEMIEMIENLVESGHAYEAEGHVLFDVASFPDYGKLSRRSVDEMKAGARVEVAPYKKNPMDFVLWKPSKEGEPAWESPWSDGRPGWHIECSVMANEALLGMPFDIHGGGIDLIFPHHENEIAQSVCFYECDAMANIWMHNGFVTMHGEKMAKSMGNFMRLADIATDWRAEAIRHVFLKTHYRKPLDLSLSSFDDSEAAVGKLYRAVGDDEVDDDAEIDTEFRQALADDLDTPLALARLYDLANQANKGDTKARKTLKKSAQLLGLLSSTASDWLQQEDKMNTVFATSHSPSELDELTRKKIRELYTQRLFARAQRDFVTADAIREKLLAEGIVVEDNAEGTTWRSMTRREKEIYEHRDKQLQN